MKRLEILRCLPTELLLDMIDHINDYEWSDVMKVRQTNYTLIRMINTVLINQYDKILCHKQRQFEYNVNR